MADDLPNLLVLRPFRLNGEHVAAGSIIPKSAFANTGDWCELCVMVPQTATQTDDAKADKNAPRATTKMP